MKICFYSCPFSFDVIGGGELQLLNTKSALEKLGHQVVLFDQWNPKFSEFDIFHIFTVQPGMGAFCDYLKSRDIPFAVSPIFWPRADATRGEMWEIEKIFKLADIIFPNSQTELNKIHTTFQTSKEKFVITVNAVDSTFFSKNPHIDFANRFEIDPPFFLCVGNIEPRKNQLAVLKAIKKNGLDQKLVCVGSIRDKIYYAECLRENKLFKYVGPLPQSDLGSAYTNCELFILASTCETPGLAALEAAYFGAPLVITEVGCTKEYFGEFANYVNPSNPESIGNGILQALSRKRTPEERNILKLKITEQFSWAQTALQINDGYRMIKKL